MVHPTNVRYVHLSAPSAFFEGHCTGLGCKSHVDMHRSLRMLASKYKVIYPSIGTTSSLRMGVPEFIHIFCSVQVLTFRFPRLFVVFVCDVRCFQKHAIGATPRRMSSPDWVVE